MPITLKLLALFGRYIEVFGGGGSILFSKDRHADLEVYNDANSETC